ncbi:MAG TPA: hypothetical protein VNC50_11175, partial [Planctomycetia bacterium]|nr:hypothetical protein [Planctomycetia bacterium]
MPTVLLLVLGFLLAGDPLPAPAGGKPEAGDSEPGAAKGAPVAATPEKASEWTPEAVASRLKWLEELKAIKDEDRKKASEAYKQAAEHFKSAAERAVRSAERARSDKEAPARTEKLKAELKAAPPAIKIETGAGTAKAVEAEINATRDMARAAHKRVEETEAEPKTRAERRKVLPQLTQELRKKIDEAKKAPPVPRPGEHVELQAARQAQYAGWLRSMNAELDGLRSEAAHYDATADLVSLERDLAARDKAQALKRLELLAAELTRRRRVEADQALKLAESQRQEKANLHPALGALAAENQSLAASRSGEASLLRSLESAETKLSALRKQRSALKQRFQAAQEKIKQSGLNIATGQALRRQQNDLAPYRNQSSGVRKRDAEIAELQGAQLDLEDRRAHLGDLDPRVREITESADVPLVGKDEFERQVRDLLAQRRDLLQALINDYDDYLGKLVDLNTVETEMVAETDKFDKFVNERVLWLKSASAFDGRELATSAQAVKDLASPAGWRDVAMLLYNDARANPRTTFLTLFILTTWALLHHWLRRRLRQLGEAVEADYLNTFALSVRALVLTCAVAAFGPSILAYLGWRLDRMYEAPPFVLAVSSGLMTAAALWITFEVLRQACRRKGLVDSHFRWKSASVLSVRRHLTLLVMFAVPMAFIAGMMEHHPNEAWRDSLGR